MAQDTFNKFNGLFLDAFNGVHDTTNDTFKYLLTDTAPTASDSVKSDLAEIASGNGYPAGGITVSVSVSESGGTLTYSQDATSTLNATGSVGPFRYAVLYNDTSGSDSLVGYLDYGQSITMSNGESFDIGSATTLFTV